MNKLRRILTCACLVAGLALWTLSAGQASTLAGPSDRRAATPHYLGVLVHASPGSDLHSLGNGIAAIGGRIGTEYPEIGVMVAYGAADVLATIESLPGVEYLEPNQRLDYSMDTSHVATRAADMAHGKVKVRGKTIDGSGIGVAIVDTGVDGTHPDLEPQMGGNVRIVCTNPGTLIGAISECNGAKQVIPVPDSDTPGAGGHGTHVAGTVAATGVSSDGEIKGAAPGATLYGVGIGTVILVENALDGLRWVLENHDKVAPEIKVVNNSWGSGYAKADENDPQTGAVTKLVDLLVEEGVTVVFAAGNAGGTGGNPRTSVQCVNPTPGVVCVANYDDEDSGSRSGSINPTSSRGTPGDPSTWPDISAPGTDIISTCRATLPVCNVFGGHRDPTQFYGSMSGTSMAAPHVSGIIALMLQAGPDLSPRQVEQIVEMSAHKFKFGDPYTKDPFNRRGRSSFEKGHGLIDAVGSVRMAARKG